MPRARNWKGRVVAVAVSLLALTTPFAEIFCARL